MVLDKIVRRLALHRCNRNYFSTWHGCSEPVWAFPLQAERVAVSSPSAPFKRRERPCELSLHFNSSRPPSLGVILAVFLRLFLVIEGWRLAYSQTQASLDVTATEQSRSLSPLWQNTAKHTDGATIRLQKNEYLLSHVTSVTEADMHLTLGVAWSHIRQHVYAPSLMHQCSDVSTKSFL